MFVSFYSLSTSLFSGHRFFTPMSFFLSSSKLESMRWSIVALRVVDASFDNASFDTNLPPASSTKLPPDMPPGIASIDAWKVKSAWCSAWSAVLTAWLRDWEMRWKRTFAAGGEGGGRWRVLGSPITLPDSL